MEMLEALNCLVEDISGRNSKLVLLVGPPRSGKSYLLNQLSELRNLTVLNVGAVFGRQLLEIPLNRRALHASELLKNIADGASRRGVLLIDNIELLFDQTLRLSPLDLLKQRAHAQRVVVAWPGELREDRLSYAASGHSEYQDYAINGLVTFQIN